MERDEFLRAAWKVMVAQKMEAHRFVFVDKMGTNTSLCALYAWAPRGRRALFGAAQPWKKQHALGKHDRRGHGAVPDGGELDYQGSLRD
jgi:hypothetical protein